MKASEIRIGNYWQSGTTKEIRCADFLDIRDMADGRLHHEPISIPLTEEWLENLGLKLSSKTDLWTINDFGIHFEFTVISTNANEELPKRDLMDIKEIKYVHELQNLYYSLTKEELVLAVNPL